MQELGGIHVNAFAWWRVLSQKIQPTELWVDIAQRLWRLTTATIVQAAKIYLNAYCRIKNALLLVLTQEATRCVWTRLYNILFSSYNSPYYQMSFSHTLWKTQQLPADSSRRRMRGPILESACSGAWHWAIVLDTSTKLRAKAACWEGWLETQKPALEESLLTGIDTACHNNVWEVCYQGEELLKTCLVTIWQFMLYITVTHLWYHS